MSQQALAASTTACVSHAKLLRPRRTRQAAATHVAVDVPCTAPLQSSPTSLMLRLRVVLSRHSSLPTPYNCVALRRVARPEDDAWLMVGSSPGARLLRQVTKDEHPCCQVYAMSEDIPAYCAMLGVTGTQLPRVQRNDRAAHCEAYSVPCLGFRRRWTDFRRRVPNAVFFHAQAVSGIWRCRPRLRPPALSRVALLRASESSRGRNPRLRETLIQAARRTGNTRVGRPAQSPDLCSGALTDCAALQHFILAGSSASLSDCFISSAQYQRNPWSMHCSSDYLLLPGVTFSFGCPCILPSPLFGAYPTRFSAMGKSSASRRRQGERLGRWERHEQEQRSAGNWGQQEQQAWPTESWDEWGWWQQHHCADWDWSASPAGHDSGALHAEYSQTTYTADTHQPADAQLSSLPLTALPTEDEDSPLETSIEHGPAPAASSHHSSVSDALLPAATVNPPAESGAGGESIPAGNLASSSSSSSELRPGSTDNRAGRPPTPPVPLRRTRHRLAAAATSSSPELVPDGPSYPPLPAGQGPEEDRLVYLRRCLQQALIASSHPSAAWAREKWGGPHQNSCLSLHAAQKPLSSTAVKCSTCLCSELPQLRSGAVTDCLAGGGDDDRPCRLAKVAVAVSAIVACPDPGFGLQNGGLEGWFSSHSVLPVLLRSRLRRAVSPVWLRTLRAARRSSLSLGVGLFVALICRCFLATIGWWRPRRRVVRLTVRVLPGQYVRRKFVLVCCSRRFRVIRRVYRRLVLTQIRAAPRSKPPRPVPSCSFQQPHHCKPKLHTPLTHKYRAGRGPNSLGSVWRLPLLCILLLSLFSTGSGAAAAKLRVVESAASTVPASAGKAGIEAGPRVKFSFAAKRAYRRARNRAHLHGQTHYRGTVHTAETLNALQGVRQPPRRRPHTSCRDSRRRLNLLSYNCGGFTSAAWAEFTHWLDTQSYDVVVVQETHWQSEGCFTLPRWYCITAAAPTDDKYSGILVMVASKLACPEHIRYTVLHPGRLLHVKIGGLTVTHSSIDVLGVYQYVWRSTATKAENLANRAVIWSQLDKTATKLPVRNTRLVMGDLNTRPPPDLGLESRHLSNSGPQDADASKFRSFIDAANLMTLNTWSGPKAFTHQHAGHRTIIDYILADKDLADVQARRSAPMHHCPLASWKDSKHWPVAANVRLRQAWMHRRRARDTCSIDVQSLRYAVRHDTPEAAQLQVTVERKLRALIVPTTADQLHAAINACLLQACTEAFPLKAKQSADAPHQQALKRDISNSLQSLWAARRVLHEARKHTARALSDVALPRPLDAGDDDDGEGQPCRSLLCSVICQWRAEIQYQRLTKQLHKQSRQRRNARWQDIASQVQEADRGRDSQALHAALKKLQPWKPRTRIQFRDAQGMLLSPHAELDTLKRHCQSVFAVHAEPPPPATLKRGTAPTADELAHAILETGVNKAVPSDCAPAAVWRLAAGGVAKLLSRFLRGSWVEGASVDLAGGWKDTEMAFIPKPPKPPTQPQNLRPLGLISPPGKAIAAWVKIRLEEILAPLILTLPQFAYTAGRSTLDCLLRVQAHFHSTRKLISSMTPSIYQRREGTKSAPCYGGITLSVDLRGAFNEVPRGKLYQCLQLLRVDADLLTIVQHLHWQSRYFVHNASGRTSVTSSNGIKQGCRLAPSLWIGYTVVLLWSIRDVLGEDYMRACVTLFADDLLSSQTFSTRSEAMQCIHSIQVILTLLESMGMQINFDKTAVLLAASGPLHRKLRRRLIVKKQNKPHVTLQVSGRTVLIPLVSSHTYLGTKISYRNAPELTVQHRLCTSGRKWQQVKRALRRKDMLTRCKRVQLWQSSVRARLLYGLSSVPLGFNSRQEIRGKTCRQLRSLAHLPAHITGISNTDLLSLLATVDPVQVAADALDKRLQQLQDIQRSQPSNIVCFPSTLDYAQELLQHHRSQLQTEQATQCVAAADLATGFSKACPDCGVYFASAKAVRTHRARAHGAHTVEQPLTQLEVASQTIGGMPQCSRCRTKFKSWHYLRKHIRRAVCVPFTTSLSSEPLGAVRTAEEAATAHDLPSATPVPAELCVEDCTTRAFGSLQHALELLVSPQHWARAARLAEAKPLLAQTCGICGQWCSNSGGVKRHIASLHKDVYQHHVRALELCVGKGHLFFRHHPCDFCGLKVDLPSRHKTTCSVLYQCALLHRHLQCRTPAEHDDGRFERGDARDLRYFFAQSHDEPTIPGLNRPAAAQPQTSATGVTRRRSPAPAAARDKPHASQPRGSGSPTGACGNEARGPDQHRQAGPGLRFLHAQQRGKHLAEPLRDQPEDETGVRQRPGAGQPIKDPAAEGTLCGVGGSLEDAGPGPASLGENETTRPSGRPGLVLQALGPQGQEARRRSAAHTAPVQGNGNTADGHVPAPECLHRAEIRSQPRHPRGSAGGPGLHNSLLDGDLVERSGSRCSTSTLCPVGRECSMASAWNSGKAGDPPPLGASAEARRDDSGLDRLRPQELNPPASGSRGAKQDDRRVNPPAICSVGASAGVPRQDLTTHILNLQLCNPHNICYMNSTFTAVVWSLHCADWPLARSLLEILHGSAANLLQALSFQLMGWARPREQHDACEFCSYFVSRMGLHSALARWHGVMFEGDRAHVHDSGPGQAIPMTFPRDAPNTPTLQHFAYAWRHQEHEYCLLAPAFTYLQLPRFQVRTDGTVTKHHFRLALRERSHQRLTLPCQTGDEVTWVPFALTSVIYHLGRTVTSGHYVTLLFHDGVTYVKGDREPARRATLNDIACAECNAYLAFVVPARDGHSNDEARLHSERSSAAGSDGSVAAAA